MKTYKFEIVVTEELDEFWESLGNKSGCDEVTAIISDALFDVFPEAQIKLVEFTDKKN